LHLLITVCCMWC